MKRFLTIPLQLLGITALFFFVKFDTALASYMSGAYSSPHSYRAAAPRAHKPAPYSNDVSFPFMYDPSVLQPTSPNRAVPPYPYSLYSQFYYYYIYPNDTLDNASYNSYDPLYNSSAYDPSMNNDQNAVWY